MLGWLFGQYWEIGRRIQEAVGDRAAYGKQLLAYLPERLTVDFGPGFTQRELRRMRQFYQVFSIRCALRPELSWTHYRLLMRVENEERRTWYMNEAADAGWSSRQLDRQIQTFYYDRLLATQGDDAKREVTREIGTTQPVTSAHRRGAGRGPASRARRGRGRVAVACARRRWLRGVRGAAAKRARAREAETASGAWNGRWRRSPGLSGASPLRNPWLGAFAFRPRLPGAPRGQSRRRARRCPAQRARSGWRRRASRGKTCCRPPGIGAGSRPRRPRGPGPP